MSTYTVVKGDSLWAIAQRKGLLVSEIAIANGGIQKLEVLQPGMVIKLPKKRSESSGGGLPVVPLIVGALRFPSVCWISFS